ncbi:hypothetical protein S83_041421 [Arachis hypogaea]
MAMTVENPELPRYGPNLSVARLKSIAALAARFGIQLQKQRNSDGENQIWEAREESLWNGESKQKEPRDEIGSNQQHGMFAEASMISDNQERIEDTDKRQRLRHVEENIAVGKNKGLDEENVTGEGDMTYWKSKNRQRRDRRMEVEGGYEAEEADVMSCQNSFQERSREDERERRANEYIGPNQLGLSGKHKSQMKQIEPDIEILKGKKALEMEVMKVGWANDNKNSNIMGQSLSLNRSAEKNSGPKSIGKKGKKTQVHGTETEKYYFVELPSDGDDDDKTRTSKEEKVPEALEIELVQPKVEDQEKVGRD